MPQPRVSLDQWRALVAVVDHDGYARAAETLHRSQSSISHAVHQIESRLGLKLFTIEGRKARLTDAGAVLYRRGRALIDEAERIEQAAANLAAGGQAQLRLAVESIFPTWLLLRCLAQFGETHPHTRVELHESVLGGTDELLLEHRVDMAICSQVPAGFLGDPLMSVRFIAVAAPTHPLHQLNRPLTLEDLRAHRHLIMRDSGARRTRSGAWQGASQRWTVSHKATWIRAACMGLGFAWYPEESIREELASGALRPLPLAEGAERRATLYLVIADPEAAGPALQQLARRLRAAVADTAPA